MTVGYTLPEPDGNTDDLWAGFEWDLPDEYNVADVALKAEPPHRQVLKHTDLDGNQTTYTHSDLREAVSATAAMLDEARLGPGDRAAVCLPTCPELLISHLAVLRIGAVVVPLSMLLGDETLAFSLQHSGADVLIIDEEREAEYDGPEIATDTYVVSPGGYGADLGGLAAYASMGANGPFRETDPHDPAFVLYTSGTTGKPKGVVQGHHYLMGSLPGYQAWFQLFGSGPVDATVWTPAEWAWAGALFDVVYPTLALGGTVVSNERRSGFNPEHALQRIDEQEISHAFMPPTALARIRAETTVEKTSLESLRVVMCGGEKLPESLFEWATDELDVTVNESYGQTEANALIGNCQAAFPVRPGSMGKPYPGHDIVLVDEDGAPVEDGEIGEIAVELPDPVAFIEYLDDEAATDAKVRDCLLLTDDLAVRDSEGYLWHRGRKDQLIITSGYRVSPLEVEEALETHSSVTDAIVGGVPDETRGQCVKACVVPAKESLDSESLKRAVEERLGAHKVPREIEFIDSVPETRSGKADRQALFD